MRWLRAVVRAQRRLAPEALLGLAAALCLAWLWCGVALAVLAWVAGARRGAHAARASGILLGALVAGSIVHGVMHDDGVRWLSYVLLLLLAGVLPWLLGRHTTLQREMAAAAWERVRHLERERALVTEQARLRERARIARDMHDLLGHDLSLLSLRAGALEVARDAAAMRDHAAEVRAGAAAATDRLRDIVTVLRDRGDRAPLEPSGEPIEEMVARSRSAGLDVVWDGTGATAGTPDAAAAVRRLVQEGLTNAAKHAPGQPVTLRLERTGDLLGVEVSNALTEGGPGSAEGATGQGIDGLRERMRLVGGTLSVGTHGGMWRLAATVPADAHAADRDDPTGESLPAGDPRRHGRRRLALAVVAPVALALAVMIAYYAAATRGTVLEPGAFDRLRVGQDQRAVEAQLPSREASPRDDGRMPAGPPGAVCRYYSDGNFPAGLVSYRLCFAGGRLVAKEDVRAWSLP